MYTQQIINGRNVFQGLQCKHQVNINYSKLAFIFYTDTRLFFFFLDHVDITVLGLPKKGKGLHGFKKKKRYAVFTFVCVLGSKRFYSS